MANFEEARNSSTAFKAVKLSFDNGDTGELIFDTAILYKGTPVTDQKASVFLKRGGTEYGPVNLDVGGHGKEMSIGDVHEQTLEDFGITAGDDRKVKLQVRRGRNVEDGKTIDTYVLTFGNSSLDKETSRHFTFKREVNETKVVANEGAAAA